MEMTTITLLLLVPLAVWRIYTRLKRLMGRTRSELWRHYAAAIGLPALVGVLAATLLGNWLAFGALALGTAAGVALGYRNMRRTRLENTQDGFFYTPDWRLGMLVSMLFIARLIYRLFEAYLHMHNGLPIVSDFTQIPMTNLAFGLLAGFYATYGVLLLRWRRTQTPVPRAKTIFDM